MDTRLAGTRFVRCLAAGAMFAGALAFIPSEPSFGAVLSAPTELRQVSEARDCIRFSPAAEIGSCESAVNRHRIVLVWKASPRESGLDGFDVLQARSANGRSDYARVARLTGKNVRFTELEQLASAALGDCFRVAAYSKGGEGPRSLPYCSESASESITLDPIAHATSAISTQYLTGGFCTKIKIEQQQPPVGAGAIRVGSFRTFEASSTVHCDDGRNTYFRGALAFDLSKLRGHRVKHATLSLAVLHGLLNTDVNSIHPKSTLHSCAATLGAGTTAWEHQSGLITPLFTNIGLDAVPPNSNVNVVIDATKVVNVLLTRPGYHGMILAGIEPAFYSNVMCESDYGDPKLTIEYARS